MTLGQKLKKLRTEKNLTQKDLADSLHVTFQTISKWESDTNEPDVATLKELSKIYECSLDYLLSEDENMEENSKQTQENATTVVTPVQPVNSTPIINNIKMSTHMCARCGKQIPEDDVVSQDITKSKRVGRHHKRVVVGKNYYHTNCLIEINKNKENAKNLRNNHNKKVIFIWSIVAGVVALGASLAAFLCNTQYVHPALGVLYSVLISYGFFSLIYCVLSASYIADFVVWCLSASIKFPGLIFSWDIDGIVWVICMKVLFAIISFLFGLFAAMFGIGVGALLSAISFPFVLIKNIHTDYSETLFQV